MKPEKVCVIEKLSSPFSKGNGSIVISKDDCGKQSLDHKYVLVLDLLDHVTLSADGYCGTFSLRRPFFVKGLGYLVRVSYFSLKMPGVIQPTGLTAVYGCTSDSLWIGPNLALSVFSLTEP